ncbi:MAG: hypothetical protein V4670_02610 [Bacteroidota bacterium]
MKNLFFISLLYLSFFNGFSQVHWLINQDEVKNCKLIKSGKFVNKISNEEATPDYFIVFSEGFATEYVDNGKYFIKSKIEFKNDCYYQSIVVECTIPNYDLSINTKIQTEILETATQDKLIKIRSKMENSEWQFFVLQKIED